MTYLAARLGAHVREHRLAAGLSQSEYARQIGIHWSYLSSIERGGGNPTLRTVERLAERMGVEPKDLLRP